MNIGMVQDTEPNARSRDLTRMLLSLIGTWKGTYSYFDERAGKVVLGKGTLVFKDMPVANVVSLDATSERPNGRKIHALTVMVAQANGASIRQMVFTESGGILQDKVITAYSYVDDENWTMESIETQQGFGRADAVHVTFRMERKHFSVIKKRRFEGGEAEKRDYESLAEFELKG